MGQVNLETG